MKILHISNYAPPHIGGIERTAKDILDGLGEHEQRLFCFNDKRETVKDDLGGIPVTRCGSRLKISSQALAPDYGKELKRTFRSFCPDAVIFHFPNPFAAHYLLKALKRAPSCKLIVWWHLDITKQKILGKFFGGQTKRLLERAERIVATSPNYIAGSPWLSRYREKCTVIPSCVDREAFRIDAATEARVGEIRSKYAGKFICLSLGRHVPYKGLTHLIGAAKLLPDDHVFLIGGTGELTDELKKQAKDDARVVFLGALPQSEANAYLHACDLFCFPSVTKNEAFGLALAEALSCGKPAVTFTIAGSGVNFVSPDGLTGIEVKNGDTAAYAEAIRTLKEDAALRERMGAAAAKRAEELFGKEKFQASVRALVEGL